MLSFYLLGISQSDSDWEGSAGAALAIGLMVVGTAHTFAIRNRTWDDSGRSGRAPRHFGTSQQAAIVEARARIQRRAEGATDTRP